MKVADKVKLYQNVYNSTVGIEFGKRNLILRNVAKDLNLRHCFSDCGFELYRLNRNEPLLILPF